MATATPDLRLPFQPQRITAMWPVPNYAAAWCQRLISVNNLLNLRLLRECEIAGSRYHLRVVSLPSPLHQHVTSAIFKHLRTTLRSIHTTTYHTDFNLFISDLFPEYSTKISCSAWTRMHDGLSCLVLCCCHIIACLPCLLCTVTTTLHSLISLSSANGNCEWPLPVHWNCLFVSNQGRSTCRAWAVDQLYVFFTSLPRIFDRFL